MSNVHQNGALLKVWIIQILLLMKNLYMHTILHHNLFRSDRIQGYSMEQEFCMTRLY